MGQLRKRLAQKIRQARGTESQRDFARRLGISKSSLHRIEMSEQNVGVDMIELFCQRLKCGLLDLFPPEADDPHEAPPRA
jgi:transcriptional regulator with XRE-family HTH domain